MITLIGNNIWWQGPVWLSLQEHSWPSKVVTELSEDALIERKMKPQITELCCTVMLETVFDVEKFSTLRRVYRITAWIMRFMHNSYKRNSKISGPLTASELDNAELYWIKCTQESAFNVEIDQFVLRLPLGSAEALTC